MATTRSCSLSRYSRTLDNSSGGSLFTGITVFAISLTARRISKRSRSMLNIYGRQGGQQRGHTRVFRNRTLWAPNSTSSLDKVGQGCGVTRGIFSPSGRRIWIRDLKILIQRVHQLSDIELAARVGVWHGGGWGWVRLLGYRARTPFNHSRSGPDYP